MDVLVFSTVPATHPAAGADGTYTHPADLRELISDALRDLAEAGLTVTGPDVTRVHPLARHISRCQTVHRFVRPDGYDARRLTEFAPWARWSVFRVGNGPFRNLDGENLAAPGNGIKVPVHADAHRRRQRNLRFLREAGLELDEEIPVIPAEEEVVLRDPAEVVHRLGALALIVDLARHIHRGELPPADGYLGELDTVSASLTVRERAFLDDIGAFRRSLFDAAPHPLPTTLRAEADVVLRAVPALEALAWATQLVDLPPGRTRARDFEVRGWRGPEVDLAGESTATLLARSPGLRGVTPLLEAFDLVHILHHGLRAGVPEPEGISGQWTKALAWIAWPRAGWGEAERLL